MIFFRKKSAAHLQRRDLLESVPQRNPSIEMIESDSEEVTVSFKETDKKMDQSQHRWLAASREKKYELDELGAEVLNLCNGSNRVVDVIRAFKDQFNLDIKEAEVAVLQYLEALHQRDILKLKRSESNGESRE